jgi:SAM-dependent methyltransferase
MTMLAAARATPHDGPAIEYVEADANVALPPRRYDAILFFLSIHYMTRNDAFWGRVRAALRGHGRIAIATFPHLHIIENELTKFFPSIPRVDLPRFPAIPALVRALREHGFNDVELREVTSEESAAAETLMERVERRYVSSLYLIDADEFERGIALMRASFSGGGVLRRTVRASVVSAQISVSAHP